jgi:hypothetical protein
MEGKDGGSGRRPSGTACSAAGTPRLIINFPPCIGRGLADHGEDMLADHGEVWLTEQG